MLVVLTGDRVSDRMANTILVNEKMSLFTSNFEKSHSPTFIFPNTEICLPKAIMNETSIEIIA